MYIKKSLFLLFAIAYLINIFFKKLYEVEWGLWSKRNGSWKKVAVRNQKILK